MFMYTSEDDSSFRSKTVAVLVPIWMDTNMAPSYEALLIWANNFFTYLSYEKLHRADLVRIFAYLPSLISWVLDFVY